MQLTIKQHIFVVTNYFRIRKFNEVQYLFKQRLRDRVQPTKVTIWKNIEKYKTEGLSINLNKDRSSRKKTERTQEHINLLQEKLIEDPKISARLNGLNISKSTFNRITKHDLKWHPNKMHARKKCNNYK